MGRYGEYTAISRASAKICASAATHHEGMRRRREHRRQRRIAYSDVLRERRRHHGVDDVAMLTAAVSSTRSATPISTRGSRACAHESSAGAHYGETLQASVVRLL